MKFIVFALIHVFCLSRLLAGTSREFFLDPCAHGFVVEGKQKEINGAVVGDQVEFVFLNASVLVESVKMKLRERLNTLPWPADGVQVITAQMERMLDEAYGIGNERRPFAFIRVSFLFDPQLNTVALDVDDHGIFSPERRSSVRGASLAQTEFNHREGTRVSLRASASQ